MCRSWSPIRKSRSWAAGRSSSGWCTTWSSAPGSRSARPPALRHCGQRRRAGRSRRGRGRAAPPSRRGRAVEKQLEADVDGDHVIDEGLARPTRRTASATTTDRAAPDGGAARPRREPQRGPEAVHHERQYLSAVTPTPASRLRPAAGEVEQAELLRGLVSSGCRSRRAERATGGERAGERQERFPIRRRPRRDRASRRLRSHGRDPRCAGGHRRSGSRGAGSPACRTRMGHDPVERRARGTPRPPRRSRGRHQRDRRQPDQCRSSPRSRPARCATSAHWWSGVTTWFTSPRTSHSEHGVGSVHCGAAADPASCGTPHRRGRATRIRPWQPPYDSAVTLRRRSPSKCSSGSGCRVHPRPIEWARRDLRGVVPARAVRQPREAHPPRERFGGPDPERSARRVLRGVAARRHRRHLLAELGRPARAPRRARLRQARLGRDVRQPQRSDPHPRHGDRPHRRRRLLGGLVDAHRAGPSVGAG